MKKDNSNITMLNKSIGLELSKLRDKSGFSQEDVVRNLQVMGIDMDRGTYSQIEIGNRKLLAHEIPFMAKVFNLSLHDFVDIIFSQEK